MTKDELIEQMLKKMGDINNSIDLDAYARGLIDMYDLCVSPPSIRERALSWWNTLGDNPLQRLIMQGELVNKYHGQMRITSSLTGREIEEIYLSEGIESNI